ncbi:hypothetical protein ACH5RR_006580 [Cinchona calisaya]|uniref:Reverse transcriptase/retrotransposon-derived protein RNase H-like domain-containing protein n=1 Tax=Cinchona calisaya TaxID=153742 RepID=A0ABD3APT2_9GENT
MVSWQVPSLVNALKGFLGLNGYYRRFVKGYGLIAKILTILLKKDAFEYIVETDQTFFQLKQAMSNTLVLTLLDFSQPFILEIDASHRALGAVLMEKRNP